MLLLFQCCAKLSDSLRCTLSMYITVQYYYYYISISLIISYYYCYYYDYYFCYMYIYIYIHTGAKNCMTIWPVATPGLTMVCYSRP